MSPCVALTTAAAATAAAGLKQILLLLALELRLILSFYKIKYNNDNKTHAKPKYSANLY